MSGKPYEFVTKEELIESLRRAEDAGTDSGDFCRAYDLAARLLAERDAYRDIAGLNSWKRGDVSVKDGIKRADEEARRLLSPSGAKREKEGGV